MVSILYENNVLTWRIMTTQMLFTEKLEGGRNENAEGNGRTYSIRTW